MQTHRTGKKNEKRKKKERQTHRFEPPQNYRPPQALRVSCMREASVQACREGREGGVAMTAQRQQREWLWWRDSVAGAEGGIHATAWALRILGVRARREARARGLSGEGSGAHELRGKKRKKKVTHSNPHKKATSSSCCTCAADAQTGGLQAAAHEACEDATSMATIRAVREG